MEYKWDAEETFPGRKKLPRPMAKWSWHERWRQNDELTFEITYGAFKALCQIGAVPEGGEGNDDVASHVQQEAD